MKKEAKNQSKAPLKTEQIDKNEYLWYALYAFAGFGLELVLQMLEGLLELSGEGAFANCLHLVLTSLLWGTISVLLYQGSKKKLGFDLLENNKCSMGEMKKQNITNI